MLAKVPYQIEEFPNGCVEKLPLAFTFSCYPRLEAFYLRNINYSDLSH